MTDLDLPAFIDAWANSDDDDTPHGDSNIIRIRNALYRGFVRFSLPNIAGRTVVDAWLEGHAARDLVSQDITLAPIVERWSAGKLTWNDQPGVNAAENVPVTIPATDKGESVEFPGLADHLQAVADGSEWFGWRIVTTSSASDQAFWAKDSGEPAWVLHVTLSDTADQPTDQRPDGGDVADASPVLSWAPISGQAKSRVQVDTPTGAADPDEVSPDYDSTMVTNIDPEFDLTGEHTVTGAGPHYWRVQVETADGEESAWSDWAEFGVAALPSLVVDSPTGTFGDPTPTVAAHLSSGTAVHWDAIVTGNDRSDIRYRTGTQTGPASFTVPLKGKDGRRVLVDDVPGWAYVRVYPAGDWTAAVGQPTYVDAWIALTWDDDAGVEAPTSLAVTQTGPGDPRHTWSWDRTEAADAWLLQVDGKTIARLEADDVEVDAGTYSWTDNGQIPPLRTHTLRVRALEDDQRSEADDVTGYSYVASGVWLLPEADGIEPVQLAGTGISGFKRSDFRATYVTHTGDEVDVIYGTPGRSAAYEGATYKGAGGWVAETVWSVIDSMEALRDSRNRMAQLVWGSQSSNVRVRDPDATSADDILPNNLQHSVTFGFVEALG